jgi:hypothetical protein
LDETAIVDGRPYRCTPARWAPRTGLKVGLLFMLGFGAAALVLWGLARAGILPSTAPALILALWAAAGPVVGPFVVSRGDCPNCGRATSMPYLSVCKGCGHALLNRRRQLIDLGDAETWKKTTRRLPEP